MINNYDQIKDDETSDVEFRLCVELSVDKNGVNKLVLLKLSVF